MKETDKYSRCDQLKEKESSQEIDRPTIAELGLRPLNFNMRGIL